MEDDQNVRPTNLEVVVKVIYSAAFLFSFHGNVLERQTVGL
jgi:hypothetical protein